MHCHFRFLKNEIRVYCKKHGEKLGVDHIIVSYVYVRTKILAYIICTANNC
jgi:hypothetical protein